MMDRGVARSGRMRYDAKEVEVIAQAVAGQQERTVGIKLHGDNCLNQQSLTTMNLEHYNF